MRVIIEVFEVTPITDIYAVRAIVTKECVAPYDKVASGANCVAVEIFDVIVIHINTITGLALKYIVIDNNITNVNSHIIVIIEIAIEINPV